jgi:small subunit ribosomal protein S1
MPEVILSEHSGFCFGVKRAILLAEKALAAGKSPVYSLGPIIHNSMEVGRLEKKGLKVVDGLEGTGSGTLIIRSHGAHPSVFKEAAERGLGIVDATCPFVKRLHEIVAMLKGEGYRVVAAGEREHPEVMALSGVDVVENAGDALKIRNFKKVGVVSQTTRSAESFRDVVSVLLGKTGELRVFNTICSATEKRQSAALELSKKADIMVVVGGYNSANTRRLAEICRAAGAGTIHVESAGELKAEDFRSARSAGVAAGASTPGWLIEEVIKKLEELL